MKQQENEREDKAIVALRRALELDPALKEAWLALAVSYANESRRGEALGAVERWLELVSGAQNTNAGVGAGAGAVKDRDRDRDVVGRHEALVDRLVGMARRATSGVAGEIDADVQIALGVLLNMTEVRGRGHCLLFVFVARWADCVCVFVCLCTGVRQGAGVFPGCDGGAA